MFDIKEGLLQSPIVGTSPRVGKGLAILHTAPTLSPFTSEPVGEGGMGVRVGLVGEPPLVSDCFRRHWERGWGVFARCPEPGLVVEIARETCSLLRLNCSLQLASHGDYGGLDETGAPTGLVKDALEGVYDVLDPAIIPTPNRLKVVGPWVAERRVVKWRDER